MGPVITSHSPGHSWESVEHSLLEGRDQRWGKGKGRNGGENLESTHPQSFLRKSPSMQWLIGEQNQKLLQVLQK